MSKRIFQLATAGTVTGVEMMEASQPSTTVTVTASTISSAASDNSLNDSGGGLLVAGFTAGKTVYLSGFTGGQSAGFGVVDSVTANKMILTGITLVDDSAGESVTITQWDSVVVDTQTIADLAVLSIADDAVTNAKLANMATQTIKGRTTGSTGDPEDLTAAQAAAIVQGDGLTATLAGFRGIPQNSNSADYTLVAADAGKHILHPSSDANARTFTIPANASVAFPVGAAVTFINQTSQVVSIAITSDTLTLAGSTTTGTRSLSQNGVATAIKISSTSWIISGAGLT